MEKVYAYRDGNLLKFKCPWGCKNKKIHSHGEGDGERASHCPKHPDDYYVVEVKE